MPTVKLTKTKLLAMMDAKLASLNLLKAALQAEPHLKQTDLENYRRRFDELVGDKGK